MAKPKTSLVWTKSPEGLYLRHLLVESDGHLSWDDMDRAKQDAGLGDVEMIELYPANDMVLYKENVRHLWEVPPPLCDNLPGFHRGST